MAYGRHSYGIKSYGESFATSAIAIAAVVTVAVSISGVTATSATAAPAGSLVIPVTVTGPTGTVATAAPAGTVPVANLSGAYVRVEFSFDDLNASFPTYTDITSRVISISTYRGRQPDVDTGQPGTLTLVLDDVDGNFDPDNSSGPYVAGLKLNRRVRVSVNGVYIAAGFVDSYERSFEPVAYSESTVSCTDRFKLFNRLTFTSSRVAESTPARVTAILNAASVAPSNYIVNTDGYASLNLVATPYVKANCLQALQDVTAAEGGQLFMDGAGKAVFQTSAFRTTKARSTTSQATYAYGSTAGIAVNTDFRLSRDDRQYANLVRLTDGLGVERVAQDGVDQGKGGLLEVDLGSTNLTGADGTTRVNNLLAKLGVQKTRIDSITLDPLTDATAQSEVAAREISDRITLALGPLGGGAPVNLDFHIEAVAHTLGLQPAVWQTTYTLTPV